MKKFTEIEFEKKQNKLKKVFLGGTCNNSSWRDKLIPILKINYFNPVVDDWTPEKQEEEVEQRENCDYVLYVITPKMTGVYSIAEVVDDSNKRPEKTLFCFLKKDIDDEGDEISFDKGQIKSLEMVSKMVKENGGKIFDDLKDISKFLNSNEKIK